MAVIRLAVRHTLSSAVSYVPELLQSCQTQPLAGMLQTVPANKSTIWQHVANTSHYLSPCATLCGQLVAVGGKDDTDITVYNETTDSWEAMVDVPTVRRLALVAVLNGKMMVVGGTVRDWWPANDVVEILR